MRHFFCTNTLLFCRKSAKFATNCQNMNFSCGSYFYKCAIFWEKNAREKKIFFNASSFYVHFLDVFIILIRNNFLDFYVYYMYKIYDHLSNNFWREGIAWKVQPFFFRACTMSELYEKMNKYAQLSRLKRLNLLNGSMHSIIVWDKLWMLLHIKKTKHYAKNHEMIFQNLKLQNNFILKEKKISNTILLQ